MKTLTPKRMAKIEEETFEEPKKPKFTVVWAIIILGLQLIVYYGFTHETLYVFLGSVLFASLYAYFLTILRNGVGNSAIINVQL